MKELGVWPYTIEANHGESPCVTVAHISGTWALCFSWILPPFWLFILSAWWPDTLRRQATEEWIASPPGRPWCLPGWRLPWRGDVWVSTVSGNWLEGIRGFLVQMILREAISCPGNKEEPGMEDGGRHHRLLFQSRILGWGWFLLICFVSTSLSRDPPYPPLWGKSCSLASISLSGLAPGNLREPSPGVLRTHLLTRIWLFATPWTLR